MNKNVFNYLNDKAHDAIDYIRAKAEAAGAYLEDHASDIKDGLVKGTATVLTVASLLGGMTGCMMQGQPPQQNQQQNQQQTAPILPGEEILSNSQLFVGTPYDESDIPPAIKHRTEEEISQTGLTAQDVLNAYDQLSLDAARKMFSTDSYNQLSNEAFEKLSVQFEGITPWSMPSGNSRFVTPFYALDPTYEPRQLWFNNHTAFPAVPITIDFTTYLDGVRFTSTIFSAGVEQSQFETLMASLGKEPYLLDYQTLMSKVDNFDAFGRFENQMAYPPITISRELILNASPEQLKCLYDMIASLRTINLEQSLPNNLEMEN